MHLWLVNGPLNASLVQALCCYGKLPPARRNAVWLVLRSCRSAATGVALHSLQGRTCIVGAVMVRSTVQPIVIPIAEKDKSCFRNQAFQPNSVAMARKSDVPTRDGGASSARCAMLCASARLWALNRSRGSVSISMGIRGRHTRKAVTPAQAGVQVISANLDSRLRGSNCLVCQVWRSVSELGRDARITVFEPSRSESRAASSCTLLGQLFSPFLGLEGDCRIA